MAILHPRGGFRFCVEMIDGEKLVYHFETISELMETFEFVRDFVPDARFVIEPALH